MSKICYTPKRFNKDTQVIISHANDIVSSYRDQGFSLSLRQIYYKFIGQHLFPDSWVDEKYNRDKGLHPTTKNTQKNYKRLGDILNNARLGGLMDWDAMEDRHRSLSAPGENTDIVGVLRDLQYYYYLDMWDNQEYRPEIWVEKDAMIDVIGQAGKRANCAYMSCKGYMGQTGMHNAGMRFVETIRFGQRPVVIHLGDHDPSGMDMSRDIEDRLNLFVSHHTQQFITFERVSLNKDQVDQYELPPDPAKVTDSRAEKYIDSYGDESWELDALEPSVINDLIVDAIESYRDEDLYEEKIAQQQEARAQIAAASGKWVKEYTKLGLP